MNSVTSNEDDKTLATAYIYKEIISTANCTKPDNHNSDSGDITLSIIKKEPETYIKQEVEIDYKYSPYLGYNGQLKEELTCNHCGFLTFRKSSLKNHMRSEHITEWDLHTRHPSVVLKGVRKVFPCSLCQYMPSSRVILNHHVRDAHGTKCLNKPPPIECEETGLKSIFDLADSMGFKKKLIVSHDRSETADYTVKQNGTKFNVSNPKFVKIGKDFVCLKCCFKSVDLSDVEDHIILDHKKRGKNFFCGKCSFKADSKIKLSKHLDAVHKSPKVFKCEECDFSGGSQYELIGHKKSCHDWTELICYYCGFQAAKKKNIIKHIARYHLVSIFSKNLTVSPVYCNNCDFSAKNKQQFDKHILDKHKSRKEFFCDKCCYSSPNKWSLEQHVFSDHKKAKQFRCSACKFVTFYKTALRVHSEKFHNSVNIRCKFCKKMFKSVLDLKKHVAKFHEKCHFCKLCKSTFSSRSDLNTHISSIHEKRKKFICHECDYKCTSKPLVLQHIKLVHLKIKKFKHLVCPHCKNYRTHNSYDLKKHIRTVHKVVAH